MSGAFRQFKFNRQCFGLIYAGDEATAAQRVADLDIAQAKPPGNGGADRATFKGFFHQTNRRLCQPPRDTCL